MTVLELHFSTTYAAPKYIKALFEDSAEIQ